MSKSSSKLSRRTLFAGAAGVGATAVAVGLMPGLPAVNQTTGQPKPAPTRGGGYRLSDHVKQYYKTTVL